MVALTPDTIETIGAFMHGYRSVVHYMEWVGPAVDPLMLIASDDNATTVTPNHWMLRLLDVRQALLQRGYARISEQVSLRVVDELFPENSSTWSLSLKNGIAQVRDSAQHGAAVEITLKGLASLFSGYYSAEQLSRLGLLTGDPEIVATASRIFAGTEPWMSDKF
jgi:predicted acetyltransferase